MRFNNVYEQQLGNQVTIESLAEQDTHSSYHTESSVEKNHNSYSLRKSLSFPRILKQQDVKVKTGSSWRPTSLRAPFLLVVASVSALLIIALQLLLAQSRRNNGVIFASNINDLPLRSTFQYFYLPTIISVIFGFLWTWIDLDARRLEPFYQLSKDTGASGRESLLLHYPVDFLASVPIQAVKFRHWPVFSASIATVLVFWGLTPSQSGIFAINTVNKTFDVPMLRSTSYITVDKQVGVLSAESTQSTANILWLNESLPPFMTKDFILAPFGPSSEKPAPLNGSNEIWVGNTQLYSVNISCEDPIYTFDKFNISYLNSTWGCHLHTPLPRPVPPTVNTTALYDTLYVGYYNDDGSAQYYLSQGSCPGNETNTFLIQWSKSLIPGDQFNFLTADKQEKNVNVTRRWCRSSYYMQDVSAKVLMPRREVLDYSVLSHPRPLPSDMFNSSDFEAAMNMGHDRFQNRTQFPTINWPNQDSFLLDMNLNLDSLPKMTPFAIGAAQNSPDEYLNGSILAESYQAAYRILFARQMADILSSRLDSNTRSMGQRHYTTQSIILVPAFTRVAQAILGIVILFLVWIMISYSRRKLHLYSDPSTTASLMSLTADQDALLSEFKSFDKAPSSVLNNRLAHQKFRLTQPDERQNPCLDLINSDGAVVSQTDDLQDDDLFLTTDHNIVQGVQPFEFKLTTGAIFFLSQIFLFVLLPVLYWKISQINGLPLPSQNQFVRQLLENYLPTAIGTFIEPFWLVLNRNLCLLQPFESLRRGQRSGHDSIGLDYSSLPPQFIIFKALRNGHVLLFVVCSMTLLANVLAIALSGLLYENIVQSSAPSLYSRPYSLQFLPLNGSAGPFIQDRGGTKEPFYISISNITSGTPMPPWTDHERFYLPFTPPKTSLNNSWSYRATTPTLAGRLNCRPIDENSSLLLAGKSEDSAGNDIQPIADLRISMYVDGKRNITCIPRAAPGYHFNLVYGAPDGPAALEFNTALDGTANSSSQDAAFCREHVSAGWIKGMTASYLQPHSGTNPSYNVSFYNSTVIVCRGEVFSGMADVIIDVEGRVQKRVSQLNESTKDIDSLFSTSSSDLLGQVHQFVTDSGLTWHMDSFPSDYNNYLIGLMRNGTDFLNPGTPIPTAEDMIPLFSALYSKNFAIVIGRNADRLLQRNSNTTQLGAILLPETKIFMSTTLFILSEAILALYITVTIVLYARRPWRILVRMPTCPASVIAFFAASHAVKDFQNTSHLSAADKDAYLKSLRRQYGFGTFVGTDGDAHVGVEMHPFLAGLKKTGTKLTMRTDSFKSGSTEKTTRLWKLFEWKSSNIREGGWI